MSTPLPETGWTTTPKLKLTVPVQDNNTDIGYWGVIAYQLGIDIENSFFLTADSHAQADPASDYPLGLTLMRITTAGATSGGWPAGGTLLTIRRDDATQTQQLLFVAGVNQALSWRLAGIDAWNAWYQVAGAGSPAGSASGRFTFNAANSPRSATIAYPAGRFTAAPVAVATTHDRSAIVSVTGESATGCTLLLGAADGSSTLPTSDYTVNWIAIQNY